MTRKTATPDEVSKALAMREAGYTVLAINQALGIPVRSLQRHFATHGARKGAMKQELVDAARDDLMRRLASDEALKEEAARLICDDLAHARHLRTVVMEAAEHLTATSLRDAVQVMRAAAAYSTAIKNTPDMLRRSLNLDRAIQDGASELPELIVRELAPEEIEQLRRQQAEDDDSAGVAVATRDDDLPPEDCEAEDAIVIDER